MDSPCDHIKMGKILRPNLGTLFQTMGITWQLTRDNLKSPNNSFVLLSKENEEKKKRKGKVSCSRLYFGKMDPVF